ncbi:VWA domain-containing protein [Fulvimarina sp. 2208YS6-2-32]|uniref:VWA domain-containing protein n=1 Tax=Fulvimarina uroteuthidis TaxID=3098149 RepID=A0ABU5I0Q0_9HYPH|nr:VWA domain-containing protein [Fulvimarina sp. 2208YS6-2-32]MDY8108962.1 VWA domain-containing protein [Fulvimarina sp. 2208YS6-2-32]
MLNLESNSMLSYLKKTTRHVLDAAVSKSMTFRSDTHGNFATITALCLVPLILVAGGAVEFAALHHKKQEMQNAADVAALAAASRVKATLAEREALAHGVFRQNVSQTGEAFSGMLSENDGVFSYSASATLPNRFLKFANIDAFDINVVAQASSDQSTYDIVFVLDNSGSMKGERMQELKAAVGEFLGAFEDSDDAVQVALVPFHNAVRLSDLNLSRSETNLEFIDCRLLAPSAGLDEMHRSLCGGGHRGFYVASSAAYVTEDGKNKANVYTASILNGRTTIRAGEAICKDRQTRNRGDQCLDFHVTRPSSFVVYDQPSKQDCVIDRDQPFDTTNDAPDRKGRKYPTSRCDVAEIGEVRPLNANLDLVLNQVQALTANGATNLTIGVQWGMEALSSTSPLTGRRAESDAFMVILSDGMNTRNRWHQGNTSAINERTIAACRHARGLNPPISIYAVNLVEGDPAVLTQCASKPEQYFSVTTASELRGVFADIAGRIKGVRLTQ